MGMKSVLVSGGNGFIGSYICQELLDNGYKVFSIDNLSKYGKITRKYDNHPHFQLIEDDVDSLKLFYDYFKNTDYIIHAAARIGGIKMFHEEQYDIISQNSKIDDVMLDVAVNNKNLKRFIGLSSSMVYENADTFPTKEEAIRHCPPPSSTYGFSKLSLEYKIKGAKEQYNLPYTIIRPFNASGIGEDDFIHGKQSHVIPDLIVKCLSGQKPLHIYGSGKQVRCFTSGYDIARGIRMAMESDKALNEDFNISTPVPTCIIDLAEIVWNKIRLNEKFEYVCDTPFKYDVKTRVPDVTKAERLLGFRAQVSLEQSIDETISYIKEKLNK